MRKRVRPRKEQVTGSNARPARPRPGPARTACVWLWPVLWLMCPGTSIAQSGDATAGRIVDGRAPPTLAAVVPGDPSKDDSRWTISLEALAFQRSNGVSQVLVSTLPGASTTFRETQLLAGTEVFNSNQFNQGYAVGPRLTLDYRADANTRLELAYLAVPNLDATQTIGPDDPVNWYVMRAPGFWQTQDFYYQGMTWTAKTDLHSLEANARFEVARSFELLAGFRWLRLTDSLTGSLTPGDANEPLWKTGGCAADASQIEDSILGMKLPGTARPCAAGVVVEGYPPFWTTSTANDLLGLQAGAAGAFATIGRLSLSGVAKAGLYVNRARQDAAVSMKKQMFHASAQGSRLALVGQGGIQASYRFSRDLSGKFGYELLWLGRVALAPGQISQTVSDSDPGSEAATGVDTGSSLLLQGFTVGIEYTF